MVIRTAEQLARWASSLPPNSLVWGFWQDQTDVEIYNNPKPDLVEGVSDDDWKKIIEHLDRHSNTLREFIIDYWNSAVSSVLVDFWCDNCQAYDYSKVIVGDNDVCKGCGEEQNIVS